MITSETNIGDKTLIDRCLSGEVLIIRRFLQIIGAHDLVRGTFISAVKQVNQNVARQIELAGFDKLHDLLSVDEFIRLVDITEKDLPKTVPRFYRKVFRRGLAQRGPIWVLRRPIIRVHIPHDRTCEHRTLIEQFRKNYGEGRLTTLRPHRDNWFKEPSTCINVWISLGTVVPGNGLSIFPQDYMSSLNYEEDQGVTRDQPVTRPMIVSMNEGDALFFDASHLHASEINYSNLTRVALSLRFAVQDPKLTTPQPKRYRQVDAGRPLSFWSLHSDKSIRRWSERLFRLFPTIDTPPPRPSRRIQQPKETASTQSPGFRQSKRDHVSVDELVTGQPFMISDRHFLVKLKHDGEQQIWRLDRRCPHEGADLALGYVEDHTIRCPWHNLPIDIRTGHSACESFDPIATHRCPVRNGQVKLN